MTFPWPSGKRAAISLTFDDARPSQIDHGMPVLDRHGVKATFYVTLRAMEPRVEDWRRAAAAGHEIGNHTVSHPCSGNFAWSRANCLESYTLERMEAELVGANERIKELTGVMPATFAYPCGQKFVGRGESVASYVPLVARHFRAGRGFRDEAGNDPTFCDLAQVYGVDSDAQGFQQLLPMIQAAATNGAWLVLASHDVGLDGKRQSMPAAVLDELCRYVQDPGNGLWAATVAQVAGYIHKIRG